MAGKEFALKCLQAKSDESRVKAIKEWFILKLSSALKIGPKVEPYFGFDIVMYSECIEFGMETCEEVTKENYLPEEIFQNMAIMHKLHLVHLDIKPENIMRSPSFKKIVFIDFGFSSFVKEEVGEKTLTKFYGSPNYCS